MNRNEMATIICAQKYKVERTRAICGSALFLTLLLSIVYSIYAGVSGGPWPIIFLVIVGYLTFDVIRSTIRIKRRLIIHEVMSA
jgi:hypothetical protein